MTANVKTNGLLGRQAPRTQKAGTRTMVLNPRFVEALMNFPLGWTDLEPLGTPVAQPK